MLLFVLFLLFVLAFIPVIFYTFTNTYSIISIHIKVCKRCARKNTAWLWFFAEREYCEWICTVDGKKVHITSRETIWRGEFMQFMCVCFILNILSAFYIFWLAVVSIFGRFSFYLISYSGSYGGNYLCFVYRSCRVSHIFWFCPSSVYIPHTQNFILIYAGI